MCLSFEQKAFDWNQSKALFCADALVLLERIPSGIADLVFLDPSWDPNPDSDNKPDDIEALQVYLGYLGKVFHQAKRILAKQGNLFLYSIPDLNGNFRYMLDHAFGRRNFVEEIVIPLRPANSHSRQRARHHTLLRYSASAEYYHCEQFRESPNGGNSGGFTQLDERGRYRLVDLTAPLNRPHLKFSFQGIIPSHGRSWRFTQDVLEKLNSEGRLLTKGNLIRLKQYIADKPREPVHSIWDDLPPRVPSKDRLYLTQKSKSILQRIVRMGAKEGGLLVDPFAGSGAALIAAESEGRRWVGGDISTQAIEIARDSLKRSNSLSVGKDYVFGELSTLGALPRHFDGNYGSIVTGLEELDRQGTDSYQLGEVLSLEEDRKIEFKEVNGRNPGAAIQNVADEYAVAFLNSDGGRILWGVRDTDRTVVGVRLDSASRDELRRTVMNKLNEIKPQIDPTQFAFKIHKVHGASSDANDLFVIELIIPRLTLSEPCFTASDEMFVRLEGVKQRLRGPQLVDWIRRRLVNG